MDKTASLRSELISLIITGANTGKFFFLLTLINIWIALEIIYYY